MKASVCRICHVAHWPREPHVWPKIPERATAVDPKPKPPEGPKPPADGAGSFSEADPAERGGGSATSRSRMPGDTGKAGRAGEAGGSPAPKFDRNAYQREYMRKKRAEERRARQKETT